MEDGGAKKRRRFRILSILFVLNGGLWMSYVHGPKSCRKRRREGNISKLFSGGRD